MFFVQQLLNNIFIETQFTSPESITNGRIEVILDCNGATCALSFRYNGTESYDGLNGDIIDNIDMVHHKWSVLLMLFREKEKAEMIKYTVDSYTDHVFQN